MNPVYIRMAAYIIVPLLALVPGVTAVDDGKVLIDIEAALMGLFVALAGLGGVFAKWGKK